MVGGLRVPRVSEIIGYGSASMVEPALHAGAVFLRFISIRRTDFCGIGGSFNFLADSAGRLSQWVTLWCAAKRDGSRGGGSSRHPYVMQGVIESTR